MDVRSELGLIFGRECLQDLGGVVVGEQVDVGLVGVVGVMKDRLVALDVAELWGPVEALCLLLI